MRAVLSLLPGRVRAFSSRIELLPLDARYGSHQQITLLALAAECRLYGRGEPALPKTLT
ncbi:MULTISPECIES: hypothetical protein [unclassified Janthinobacterium]|uniref:hypothetical protein n=1 Tax=unclassified Janthinobacterium TaxID=2610881 RepID=UPI001E5BBE62|nr:MULTISPECIES: hypothetical protein [unclassified Janthinobacterium]MCC7642592.1 hypothetical protein [Janthinobacterium sp. EB271-G4-3-1]MCC7689835.1 hypothetical protein [Janthinobacterium sp. EB271-G4-3-2]